MRLLHAWIGNDGKAMKAAKGKLFQVRWRLNPGAGRIAIERKLTRFRTKAEANAFIERLTMAEYRMTDAFGRTWRFDADGQPTDEPEGAATLLGKLEEYVAARWTTLWSPGQRTKVRGRLLRLVAVSVDRASDREALLDGLESQKRHRGARPEPASTIEWAARWLRDVAFYPDAIAISDEMAAGERWLRAASMSVASIDSETVTQLRIHFTEGQVHSTARTYWQGTVIPFLNWLRDTEVISPATLAGQPKLRRDLEGERPDPRRIPDPTQAALVAAEMGRAHGEPWELFTLLGFWCALRISEALYIRLSSFIFTDDRWWLEVELQERRTVGACTDGGETKIVTGTKATRDRTPTRRLVPIPDFLAKRLVDRYGETLGVGDDRLFVGPRGGVANDSTVREWWHEAVRSTLGDALELDGITPHAMRHAGMTWWFAAGKDHKLIQRWGGWTSIVQMLDTYRGVIESLVVQELDGLDDFASQWELEEQSLPASDAATESPTRGGVVVDLLEWRQSRSASS